MKHLINIGFIIILVVVVLYVFKDELFYSPPEMKNENIAQKVNIPIKEEKPKELEVTEEKTTISKPETKNEVPVKSIEKEIAENKNLVKTENLPKQESAEKIKAKGKVIEIKQEGDKIKGVIEVNGEKLNFEINYDPDIMLLLEDAKKLDLPLTFVIKKEGNKAYIEDIK